MNLTQATVDGSTAAGKVSRMNSGLKRVLFFAVIAALVVIPVTFKLQKEAELKKAQEGIENHISLWKFDLGKSLNLNQNIGQVEKVAFGLQRFPISFYEVKKGDELILNWPKDLNSNLAFKNCAYLQSYSLPLPGLRVGAGQINVCISEQKIKGLAKRSEFFISVSGLLVLAVFVVGSFVLGSYRSSLTSSLKELKKFEKDPSLKIDIETDDKPTQEIIKTVKSVVDSRLYFKEKARDLEVDNEFLKRDKLIAHDMKNAISVIEGAVRDGMEYNEWDTGDLLEGVEKLTNLSKEIVNKRCELDSRRTFDAVEVYPLINVAKKFLEKSFKNVEFKIEVPKDLKITCNAQDFIRVLENVLSNSAEAFEGNKGVVRLKLESDNNNYKISVIDNGKGIPEENLQHVFDENFTSGKKEGRGVGLSFVKKKMKQFGGQVTLSSKLGKGTELGLIFPKDKRQPV